MSIVASFICHATRALSCPQLRSTWRRISHSLGIEYRLLTGAVTLPRSFFADGVGPLENPVLPGGQTREDFRFHCFRPGKAQIGFHAGQAIGRETRAFFQKHAHLVVPIDIVESESDEAEALCGFGLERFFSLSL